MNKKSNDRFSLRWLASMSPLAVVAIVASAGASAVAAFELGHARVSSAPGQPLVIQVPITNLSAQEASSIEVGLAPASAWQATGLNPPVPLGSLSLSVGPGRTQNARLVELRSTEAADSTVVDVLLSISTSASSRTVQTSIIVPPPPKVRLAAEQVIVQRGDTLSGIAQQFPVQGANLYQQLWALYSTNSSAFLRENMNLLKTGAALRIPDADAVRAVDPAFAKAQYLEHVRAFREGRGGGQGNQGIAADAATQTLQSSPEQQQGSVEAQSSQTPPPANDEVRLTSAEQDAQAAQADAQAARAKALAEELERKQALEQNISALQGAIDSNANASDDPTASQTVAADQADVASDQSVAAATEPSQADSASQAGSQPASDAPGNFFTKASQWVSDNTTAAIALILALIALILAWALRATKSKSAQTDASQKRVEHAATDFEQKLKDIDLSLDDKPEPTLSKTDSKG